MGAQLSSLVQQAVDLRGSKEFYVSKVKLKEKELVEALEQLVEQLPKLTLLEARSCKIQKIPYELVRLLSLEVLNLEDNKLSTVPSLAKLKDLKELRLNQNRFTAFPALVSHLMNLQLLHLGDNQITDLPKDITGMQNLQALYLLKNSFDSFPLELCALPNLAVLDLSENRITALPKEVAQLLQLENLNLRRNELKELPKELSGCQKLKELDVSENKLNTLPATLGRMQQLTNLYAQHNLLTQLPPELGNATELRGVKLHDNMLKTLPLTIGQLTNLTELCLQENELVELPSEIGNCTSLRKLYLEYNQLQRLPSELARLEGLVVLILHHNELKEVPPALLQMKQLLRLSLDNNKLPSEVQEVIRSKGALALLRSDADGGFGERARGNGIGTTRSSKPTIPSGLNRTSSQQWRRSIHTANLAEVYQRTTTADPTTVLVSPRGGNGAGSSAEDSNPLPRATSFLSPEQLKLLQAPKKVESPEDEMKRFVESRRKSTSARGPSASSSRAGTLDASAIARARASTAAVLAHSSAEHSLRPPAHAPLRRSGRSSENLLKLAESDNGQSEETESEEDSVDAPSKRRQTVAVAGSSAPSLLTTPRPVEDKASEDKNIPSYSKFKVAFDRLLSEQDFSNRRKETLKKLPANQKWKLLTQYKGSTLEMLASSSKTKTTAAKAKLILASDFCAMLKGRPTAKQIEDLFQAMESQPQAWVAQFVEVGGIDALVRLILITARKLNFSVADYPVLEAALKCIRHLLNVSLRSVLTTTDSVCCVALCLYIPSVPVRDVALDILSFIMEVHFIGHQLVLESFDYYHKVRGLPQENRFARLMDPLIEHGYSVDSVINSAFIINRLICDEENLEKRQRIRREFVHMGIIELIEKLRLFSSDILDYELDIFEEELLEDYEEMISKFEQNKVLEGLEDERGKVEGDHLRVLIDYTGQQVVVPLEETTTVQSCIDTLMQKHPIPQSSSSSSVDKDGEIGGGLPAYRSSFFGLLHEGTWLENSRTLASYELKGEVICQLKLRPWNVPVLFSPSLQPTAEASSSEIEQAGKDKEKRKHSSKAAATRAPPPQIKHVLAVDPAFRVSEALAKAQKAFELEEGLAEEYGFYLEGVDRASPRLVAGLAAKASASSQLSNGIWLEETRRLAEYRWLAQFTTSSVQDSDLPFPPQSLILHLRRKPRVLKVYLTTSRTAEEMRFEADMRISDVIRQIVHSMWQAASQPGNTAHQEDEDEEEEDDESITASSTANTKLSSKDYGLYSLRKKKHDGQWLKPTRTLSDYSSKQIKRVRLLLRPRPLTVHLPSGKHISLKTQFADPVNDVLGQICGKKHANLPRSEHSLYLVTNRSKVEEGAVLLDPERSLRNQNVPFHAHVFLGPRKEYTQVASDAGSGETKNIWEEFHTTDGLVFEKEVVSGGEKMVEAGTLNKLVQHLTSETEVNSAFQHAFLLTYRSFSTPDELFSKLLERFHVPPYEKIAHDGDGGISAYEQNVKKIQLRVCLVMRDWIQTSYYDLNFPQCDLARKVRLFIQQQLIEGGHKEMAVVLQKALDNPPAKRGKDIPASSKSIPKTKMKNVSDRLTLFGIDEEELARQLTLKCWHIYVNIEPTEFLGSAWSEHKAPNIVAMIDLFNHVSLRFATEIVQTKKLRERAKLLTHIIKVAQHLKDMHNYHILTAVISGINNSAVLRLKWTRGKLHRRSQAALVELESLMSMEGSFKRYRQSLAEAAPPCIPYIGVYLTDLTFIKDGNTDLAHGLINFGKRRLVYGIISTIQKYQEIPYQLAPADDIQRWIAQPVMSDKELYAASLLCEPRNATKAQLD
ncbi:Receptor-like protein kinase 2 [Balamuthia mandrillaris]